MAHSREWAKNCRDAWKNSAEGECKGLRARIEGADALLFDGTVLYDDDMLRAGVGSRTGWRMGHVPMRGEGGSVEAPSGVSLGRRTFVPINNTHPVLTAGSPARRGVAAAAAYTTAPAATGRASRGPRRKDAWCGGMARPGEVLTCRTSRWPRRRGRA